MWFREFLQQMEVSRPEGPVLDPMNTALKWASNTPSIADLQSKKQGRQQLQHSDRINEEEGWKIAELISDPRKNNIAMAAYMSKSEEPGVSMAVYEKDLIPNLLQIKPGEDADFPRASLLAKANCHIIIPGPGVHPMFGFGGSGEGTAHELLVIVPPLIYNNQAKIGIWSGIMHESRHALDFAMNITIPGASPKTMDGYANMIDEARAHGDQIVRTLNLLVMKVKVSPEKAIELCERLFITSGTSEFRMAQETMPVVKIYLDFMRKDTSLWLRQQPVTAEEGLPYSQPPAMVANRDAELLSMAKPYCREIFKHLMAWIEVHNATHFVNACPACKQGKIS